MSQFIIGVEHDLNDLRENLKEFIMVLENFLSHNSAQMKISESIYTEVKELGSLFDQFLLKIPVRALKALILHDTKGMLLNFNGSVDVLYKKSQLTSKSTQISNNLTEMFELAETNVRRIKYFAELVRLATLDKNSNTESEFLILSDVVAALSGRYNNPEPGVLTTTYFNKDLNSNIFLEVFSNFGNIEITKNPEIVFALHTIFLNMTYLGASQIIIEALRMPDRNLIRIKDNLPGGDAISLIMNSLYTEPQQQKGTDELMAERGLSLANSMVRDAGGYITCEDDGNGGKIFSIHIPLQEIS